MVLVAVLWMIALLSALAMAAAATFRSFAGVMSIDDQKAQLQGLLSGGLEVGADMLRTSSGVTLLDVRKTVPLGTGSVHVRLNDEGGRIDIGKAPVEVLSSMFRSIGVSHSDEIAARVVSWRLQQGGSPSDDNQKPGQSGGVPGANMPFSDVHGLANVPGINPEWVIATAPLTTVFGNTTVNPLTASAEVLSALPAIQEAKLRTFLDARRRNPSDTLRLMAILSGSETYLKPGAPQAVSVSLRAQLTNGLASAAQAIIVLPPGDDLPYRVLAWNSLDSSQESEEQN
jgi:general secretion pathway protein K